MGVCKASQELQSQSNGIKAENFKISSLNKVKNGPSGA